MDDEKMAAVASTGLIWEVARMVGREFEFE